MLKNIFKLIIIVTFILILILVNRVNFDSLFQTISQPQPELQQHCNPFVFNVKQKQYDLDGFKYPAIIPLYSNRSINFTCLNKVKQKFLILIWTGKLVGSYDFDVKFKNPNLLEDELNCPVHNCQYHYDRSESNKSHAIIFNMRERLRKLPHRLKTQKWIFYQFESPIYDSQSANYNTTFNWTCSYRHDSDCISHYHTKDLFNWIDNNTDFNENENFLRNKTEFASIISSHCGPHSGRGELVTELKKYINISHFGSCGKTKCPIEGDGWNSKSCKNYVGLNYKFYFSFENSICKDYITEKLFYILRFNIIPVVFGSGPYDKILPKSGYINVFDFRTPKDLAEYLLKVGNNATLYNSYFKWKKHIKHADDNEQRVKGGQFCDLCIKLNINYLLGNPIEIGPDMRTYWNKEINCVKPNLSNLIL